jgi:Na+-transporting methylmalonyl-CoA/oxaloacetate decarboxylase gamma subunit
MNLMIPTVLAATLAERPTLSASAQNQIDGLSVVLLALAGLWLVVAIVGAGFRALAAAEREGPPPATPATEGFAGPIHGEIEPEMVAVLAAAIHAALGSGYLVTSIRKIQHASPEDNVKLLSWSAEGRRQIFSSHRTR